MSAILALLSPRIMILVAISIFLAGTHWSAYRSGQHQVRIEWQADIAERTAAALVAEQSARAKEQALQAKTRKVANDYRAETQRRAAADARAADSLQRLDAALAGIASAAAADPTAAARADDDPRDGIIAECSRSLVGLDKAHRSLVDQTRALQQYAAGVCVSPAPPILR